MDPMFRLWGVPPDEHRDRDRAHRQAPPPAHRADRGQGRAAGDDRLRRQISGLLASALLLAGCSSGPVFVARCPKAAPIRSSSVPSSPPPAAVDDALVIAGTGDIAEAGASTMANATSTADLVRAARPQVVFTVGDNAYPG